MHVARSAAVFIAILATARHISAETGGSESVNVAVSQQSVRINGVELRSGPNAAGVRLRRPKKRSVALGRRTGQV
jgi:hypothetical protein